MTTPTDIRLYNALQKLKGFTKLIVEADGKMKVVRDQAKAVAEAQRKISENYVPKKAVAKPSLTLVT